jgi:hypothetical protein
MRTAVQSQRSGDEGSSSPKRGCAMTFQKSHSFEKGHYFISGYSKITYFAVLESTKKIVLVMFEPAMRNCAPLFVVQRQTVS